MYLAVFRGYTAPKAQISHIILYGYNFEEKTAFLFRFQQDIFFLFLSTVRF